MISDVKNKIQGLIDSANETTGKEDATLTDAIMSLKDGFGGGVEYTTGRVTYGNTYGDKKILHGLSKKPKLFILRMDGYNTVAGTTLCGAFYTEVIAGLFRNNETTMPSVGFWGAATVPGIEMAANNGVTADDTQFVIHNPTTRYTAGDYTWEAWTW